MPNCFQLTRKGQTEPTGLAQIDEEICVMLGVPVHPTQYVCGWFDTIGFSAACGKTLAEIAKVYEEYFAQYQEPADAERAKIAHWLDENYKVHAWCER